MNIQDEINNPDLSPAERASLIEISKLNSKADFEKYLYEKAPPGKLSRADCKTFVSKMFRIVEAEAREEAKQEAEQRKSIYNVMLGWFKTVAGRA